MCICYCMHLLLCVLINVCIYYCVYLVLCVFIIVCINYCVYLLFYVFISSCAPAHTKPRVPRGRPPPLPLSHSPDPNPNTPSCGSCRNSGWEWGNQLQALQTPSSGKKTLILCWWEPRWELICPGDGLMETCPGSLQDGLTPQG